MFRITIVLLVLCTLSLCLTAAAQTAKALPSIEVTAPKDVAAVNGLNDALSALSEKVTACVNAGGKPEKCQCSDPKDLSDLRKRFADVLRQHPEWKDQILSYRRVDKEGRNVSGSLIMGRLRLQLEALKCE